MRFVIASSGVTALNGDLALELLAEPLLGGGHVAVVLCQCLLAVHHAQPRLGAQGHDILGCEACFGRSHLLFLLQVRLRGRGIG